MTASATRRVFYHGYMLDELQGPPAQPIEADLALYMAGWERRAGSLAERRLVNAKKSLVLSFSDAENTVTPATWLVHGTGKVETVEIGSHYEIVGCIERLLELIRENPALFTGRVFLDATCVPKYMLQWVIMELLTSKIPADLIVGYVSGKYAPGFGKPAYDQGVSEYVYVPHSCGGGVSTRRACIAALGADERLISDYFENETGFDRYFLMASAEISHTAIAEQVRRQIESLRERHYLEPEAIGQVPPYAFLGSLGTLEQFIRSSDDCDSWDLFCSGPKPHAIASCLLAMKHRAVRLVGRVPRVYDLSNVDPGETVSFLRIVDLTSPRVATLRRLAEPFP